MKRTLYMILRYRRVILPVLAVLMSLAPAYSPRLEADVSTWRLFEGLPEEEGSLDVTSIRLSTSCEGALEATTTMNSSSDERSPNRGLHVKIG